MSVNEKIDKLEAVMADYPTVDCPLTHRFTKGMYVREIFMPKDTWVTSLIHRTNHPFFLLKGKVSVYSENDGEQLLEAPYIGITTPNTRRVLYIHEDTIWATAHPTDIAPENESEEAVQKAVDLITEQIIEPHENELLGGIVKNNILNPITKTINQ